MALFKAVVWALIFLTKLRFPPGVSIAIVYAMFNIQTWIFLRNILTTFQINEAFLKSNYAH